VGLRILGPLELVAGRRSFKIGGPREQMVLATLALNANRVTSVEQLMDAVWGDDPPSTARGQIQGCISGLRKLFGDAELPDAIKTRASGYVLSLADDDLDSERFAKLVALAHRQAADRQPAAAAATLRAALELWTGPALDGVPSESVQRRAALLEDARVAAIEERMRIELELGRHEEISGELRSLLDEYPLRERFYGFLALALYRSGRQADALEVCRRARDTLVAELGIEPGPELRELERAMLNGDPALSAPNAAAPPAAVEPATASAPRQLPASTADFIGRSSQIEEILRLLSDHTRYAVPVVGIAGRGGIGKSTLALRIAHEVGAAYPDGHLYLDLRGPDGEDSTGALLARFLRALGISAQALPDDVAERMELYRSRLADRRLLLVLDDVTSEEQVRPLLPGSPTCAVIMTSRSRLGALSGAHWISLDGFDRDTSMDFLASIVGRQRLEAEPKAAEELVAYCGGLPLALRIAGARLASRPHWRIAELARRLKNEVRRLDEFSHHGLELRSSIGLSYRSLPEQAKRLFRLVAVIQAVDFPAWAAAALLDIDLVDAEETLERLVDVQLLEMLRCPARGIRYRLHDLIRVYAKERLLATETEAERREALARLLGGWLALAEQAHRMEYGGDYTILHGSAPRTRVAEWAEDAPITSPMDWLENERAALVAAIRQAADAGMAELCWDLALTSVSLFEVKGYLDDWRETTELAYQVCLSADNRAGRAAMLYSLGTLTMFQKRIEEAEQYFAEALQLFQADGDIHGQALVLRNAAFVDRLRGNVETMLTRYTDALEKMRAVGDLIGEANILRSLAKFRIDEGDLGEAREMLAAALRLCHQANYKRGEAQVASRSAELELLTGQLATARQLLNSVLSTVREIGDRIGEAHALYGLGMVRRREGRLDTAESTLAHALAIAEEVGARLIEAQALYALGELGLARADDAVAAGYLARARELFEALGSSVWLAKTLILLSELSAPGSATVLEGAEVEDAAQRLRKIESKEAARLLGQMEEVRSAMLINDSVPRIPGQAGDSEWTRSTLHIGLDPED
jgi:DNA-binding SARP family transcriptional activator/tetratricopeptide (TPR) repeat protein